MAELNTTFIKESTGCVVKVEKKPPSGGFFVRFWPLLLSSPGLARRLVDVIQRRLFSWVDGFLGSNNAVGGLCHLVGDIWVGFSDPPERELKSMQGWCIQHLQRGAGCTWRDVLVARDVGRRCGNCSDFSGLHHAVRFGDEKQNIDQVHAAPKRVGAPFSSGSMPKH